MAGPLRRWWAARTLRTRLTAGVLVLFTLASAGVGFVTVTALRDSLVSHVDQQLRTGGTVLAECVEDYYRYHTGCPQPGEPAPGAFGSELALGPAGAIGVWVSGSTVAAGVNRANSLLPVTLGAAQSRALAAVRPGRDTSVDLGRLGDYRVHAVAAGGGDRLLTGLPLASVEQTVTRLALVEVVVFAAALALTGALVAGLVRLLLAPLRRVAKVARQVRRTPLASGEVDLPHRVAEEQPGTEVGELSAAFNRMLGHVESSLAARAASEERLRQFIADASHELRTPLAAIRSYAEFARRTPGLTREEIDHALARVHAQSERMGELVEDLLLLARLDEGRPLSREPVDLTRAVLDAVSDARVSAPDHKWRLELPEEPVVVEGDALRLHQVVTNLLANAARHTPGGTAVTCRVTQAAEATELTVADDGPGIPAQVLPHVFERFARGEASRSRAAGSTGLGLAIVRAVVEAHGGTVSVASRPGSTEFAVRLPRGG